VIKRYSRVLETRQTQGHLEATPPGAGFRQSTVQGGK
jgi:hypothetical protein